ncbi:MAG: hypothetical protein HY682_05280 [Chloroflexi bacterium]|nr:hypothetical protein [Chloroflexota bacterium]
MAIHLPFGRRVRPLSAQGYGINPDELEDFYPLRNLLRTRILGENVVEANLFLAGDRSSKTTGAMIRVDGGLRDAFPR